MGMFGVDTANSKWGVWGNIRKSLGLPAFDQWDDYRVERMLANMTADGTITTDQAIRSMISKEGDIWQQASSLAAREFAGGSGIGWLTKQIGLPTQVYPYSERYLRQLKDDYENAWDEYHKGNVEVLSKFQDNHPEYDARLALWDKPEERIRKFIVDELWDRYEVMPKLHKDQLKETFGDTWETMFLAKETRNPDNIPLETLQVWLKLMGGDPPGTLTQPAVPIEFAKTDEAWRAQQFYEMRTKWFPDFWKWQNEYFKLDKKGRKKYMQEDNPVLGQYWSWRDDFLHRNPDVAPYVTDDYEFDYESLEALQQAQQTQPNLTLNEWTIMLGGSVTRILRSGEIPPAAREQLEDYAEQVGMTLEELYEAVNNAP
jgi:hypothetical protein